jgi:chlorobactene glucosyltransferase
VIWLVPAGYLALLMLIVVRYARRGPRLADYPPQPAGPLVSVIIPARNEAENIERCVRSVLAAAYAPLEVIVVDDRSTDGTGEIVERLVATAEAGARLRVLRGSELPPGWFGKPWAVVQGYRTASGELLLFTDADTVHTPELLPRTVAALAVR